MCEAWAEEDEWQTPSRPMFVSVCDDAGSPNGKAHSVSLVAVQYGMSIAYKLQHGMTPRYGRWFVEVDGPATCKRCLSLTEVSENV